MDTRYEELIDKLQRSYNWHKSCWEDMAKQVYLSRKSKDGNPTNNIGRRRENFMKIVMIILCIIGYIAIGFGLSVTYAKGWLINEKDEAAFLFLWPALLIGATGSIVLEWLTKMAQKLSEKLPK